MITNHDRFDNYFNQHCYRIDNANINHTIKKGVDKYMPKHSKKRSTIKKRLRKQKQKKLANEAKIKLLQDKQQEKK